jgi:quercetin dioxygenase-like cupin family protein
MVDVIRIEDIPAVPVGDDEGEVQVREFITSETVGAKGLGGEDYLLAAGASSQTFRLDGGRQFFYVQAGQAEAQLGDLRQTVRAGHGLFADPGEECRFNRAGEEGLRFYRLTIPPASGLNSKD